MVIKLHMPDGSSTAGRLIRMIKKLSMRMVPRGCDSFGCGDYGASRGDRRHNGTDFACGIEAPVGGQVTKLGYPYADDLSYRYVEITDVDGYRVRVFYIDPLVEVGKQVQAGDLIGTMQTLQGRYPGITDHVHVEVKRGNGTFISWDEYRDA